MPLLVLAFLGSDDDDTIRSTRAINGCSGRIFEHIDAGNVVHIDHIQRYIGRYTVDDYQRLRIVDRTHTADIKTDITTRCT